MDDQSMSVSRSPYWSAVERPVFIVGVERSGTTLLRSLLCAHSRFAVSPETHFMGLADTFGARERTAPEDFEGFWSALERHLDARAIAIDLPRVRNLLDETGARDFRTVFAALLAAQAERAGKLRVGEKTPGHEHYLDRLFDWFPEAKVLFVHRDPRGCAASVLKAPWVQAQLRPEQFSAPLMRRTRLCHVAFKAEEWRASQQIEQARVSDPRILSTAYEELVSEPVAAIERVCAFLGESFEAAMLKEKPTALVDTSKRTLRWRDWTAEHERRAASPIARDRLDRWREELTPTEIAVLESVCAEGMAAFGYAPALSQPAHRRGHRRYEQVLWADRLERSGRHALRDLLRGRNGARAGLVSAAATEPALAALAAVL